MKNSRPQGPRSKSLRLLVAGATLSALLAAPVAGSAASLANAQFHIRALNSEQPEDFWAIKPFFEGKPGTETPIPGSTDGPGSGPGTVPVPEPTQEPTVTPAPDPVPSGPTAPPAPVDPMPNAVAMTINTALPGCKPSAFDLEFTSDKMSPSATISWGDGAPTTAVTTGGVFAHSYSPGVHQIKIEGRVEGITRAKTSGTSLDSNSCIESLDHLGSKTEIRNLKWMLRNAVNLKHVAEPPASVKDLSGLFYGATNYNEDISGWDMSNVTDVNEMFRSAKGFNQDISSWNMSNVTSTSNMFRSASTFNKNLSNWNVSNVTDFSGMFQGATKFNGKVTDWNTSKGENFSAMFSSASAFNQSLSNWNMENALDLRHMFSSTSFNGDVTSWKTPRATSMSAMFFSNRAFNQNIANWQTGSVVDFSNMFGGSITFNQNISGWDTASATNMSSMFNSASSFTQNLSGWKVSKVFLNGRTDFSTGSKLTTPQLPRFP